MAIALGNELEAELSERKLTNKCWNIYIYVTDSLQFLWLSVNNSLNPSAFGKSPGHQDNVSKSKERDKVSIVRQRRCNMVFLFDSNLQCCKSLSNLVKLTGSANMAEVGRETQKGDEEV